MEIFPMIQPETVQVVTDLPLYKEIEWDFNENKIVYREGLPSIVTGRQAVLIWALKALRTKRTRHEIYSWDYGSDIEDLIGQAYTYDLKRAEAVRYIRECLIVNPYITDVTDIKVKFEDGLMTIECKIVTLYGEVEISV